MPYMNLRVIALEETPDPNIRGAFKTKVIVEEVKPRRLSINLSKANAETLMMFTNLQGKTAMIPCREGSFNGQAFLSLTDEPIIPLPDSSPASITAHSGSVSSVDVPSEQVPSVVPIHNQDKQQKDVKPTPSPALVKTG